MPLGTDLRGGGTSWTPLLGAAPTVAGSQRSPSFEIPGGCSDSSSGLRASAARGASVFLASPPPRWAQRGSHGDQSTSHAPPTATARRPRGICRSLLFPAAPTAPTAEGGSGDSRKWAHRAPLPRGALLPTGRWCKCKSWAPGAGDPECTTDMNYQC